MQHKVLKVNASDNVSVSRVEFTVNDVVVFNDSSAPFSFDLSTSSPDVPNGNYTIRSIAYDTAGNQTTSSPITVRIRNPDIDRSGTVGLSDLSQLISGWNQNNSLVPTNVALDLDDDGTIGFTDLSTLISRWGL